jgi:hypothetical protein
MIEPPPLSGLLLIDHRHPALVKRSSPPSCTNGFTRCAENEPSPLPVS